MNSRTMQYQGLRLLFFMSIAACHCGSSFFIGGAELCSFFFVISGFFYKFDNLSWPQYMLRKANKIYFVYWILFSIQVAGFYFKGHLPYFGWNILPHVFLLQSLIPSSIDQGYYFWYLGPSWFLSSLLVCYAVSPFLYRLYLKGNTKIWMIAILILWLLFLGLPAGKYSVWFHYISPLFRCLEYSMGILLAMMIRDRLPKREPFPYFIFLCIAAYILAMKFCRIQNYSTVLHIFIISVMYLYPSKIVGYILGNRFMCEGAAAGLWIYLGHVVVMKMIPLSDPSLKALVVGIVLYAAHKIFSILAIHLKTKEAYRFYF